MANQDTIAFSITPYGVELLSEVVTAAEAVAACEAIPLMEGVTAYTYNQDTEELRVLDNGEWVTVKGPQTIAALMAELES